MASSRVEESVGLRDRESFPDTLEALTESPTMHHQIHTYSALLRQIHNDLRVQHPEWIQPNGDSPLCDSYEARLMKLLDASRPMESNDKTVRSDFRHGHGFGQR
jgi:hypothetical protein